MKKRRQHYVWRKYLAPWTDHGKIWCHRNGEQPFQTSPVNVAVERDFYKLTELTQSDLHFVYKVAIEPIRHPELKRMNEDWLNTFEEVFRLDKQLRRQEQLSHEIVAELDEVMHNLDEEHHTRVEHSASTHLDALINGDTNFYDDDDAASEFLYFLASQYFRTKNIRESVLR
ncbi:MAG TPA: DUF4238 domain-containing protein, partial [Mariprofundaceae bacterium]|nr:DUF4238 domain-containing protein [Mariprofundaceae bacterium]